MLLVTVNTYMLMVVYTRDNLKMEKDMEKEL